MSIYYCFKKLDFFGTIFNESTIYCFKELYSDDLIAAYQFKNTYGFFDMIMVDEFQDYFISINELRKNKLKRLNILSQK